MIDRFEMFTVLTSKINRCIKRIKSEEMGEFELKSLHVSCLYYLYKKHGLTAKELQDICGEDKAQISRSLEYLEEKCYIQCNSSLKKRYKSTLYLTEKGMQLGKIISNKIEAILEKVSGELKEEERDVLYHCLNVINNNLHNLCKEYGE